MNLNSGRRFGQRAFKIEERMHSLISIFASGLLVLLPLWGPEPPLSTIALVLAGMVAMLGLPHGALDHRVGKKLLRSYPDSSAMLIFFVSYLAVVLVVVAGWFVAPQVTVMAFFCLSAWHFGLEEDERSDRSRWQWAALFARGGMVIWVPAVFQGTEIVNLLAAILPASDFSAAGEVVALIQFAAPVLIALTLFDAIFYSADSQQRCLGLSAIWLHRLRLASFAILFATANPLVSFGLYFCAWHSIRGLIHLRQQFGESMGRFGLSLLPITVAALVLFAIGFVFSPNFGQVTPAIIQTLFIGLSAVAIPHLLLHILADWTVSRPHPKSEVPA